MRAKYSTRTLQSSQDQTIRAVFLASGPNSGPRIVHNVSLIGAVIYALSTSPALTSRSLRAAIVKAKHTVSRETMLAEVMVCRAVGCLEEVI